MSTARGRGHLLRILGVTFGVAVVIGGTIGSGILRTPGEVAAQLRAPWLIIGVWLLGGLYAVLCTLAVTELATTYPVAGGWFVYSRRAFGKYAGFVVGCCDWMMQSTAIAYLSVAFGEFAAGLQPRLVPYVNRIGLGCLLILATLNWLGLRAGSRTQEITSFIKAFSLIVFVTGCFFLSPSGSNGSVQPNSSLPLASGGVFVAFVIALQAVIVTYDGWYSAIYFVEEDKDPSRNMPRSSLIGTLACVAIFVLVNFALLHILPIPQLAASQVPAAEAANIIFGGHGKQFILIISMIVAVSTVNATILMSPRILFGMSREGLLPRWFTSVNPGGTPATALLLSTIASGALIVSGNFDSLIAICSFLYVAAYISGFASLFVLRSSPREDAVKDHFKMWGYPWTNLAVLLASAGFLIASVFGDLRHSLFTLILLVLTYPLYFFLVKRQSR